MLHFSKCELFTLGVLKSNVLMLRVLKNAVRSHCICVKKVICQLHSGNHKLLVSRTHRRLQLLNIPDTGNLQFPGVWDTSNLQLPGIRDMPSHDSPSSRTLAIHDSLVSQTQKIVQFPGRWVVKEKGYLIDRSR